MRRGSVHAGMNEVNVVGTGLSASCDLPPVTLQTIRHVKMKKHLLAALDKIIGSILYLCIFQICTHVAPSSLSCLFVFHFHCRSTSHCPFCYFPPVPLFYKYTHSQHKGAPTLNWFIFSVFSFGVFFYHLHRRFLVWTNQLMHCGYCSLCVVD